ncbi:MAG: hypothetical protein Q9215_006362 [Flavoplaca cf. flavocitrina]
MHEERAQDVSIARRRENSRIDSAYSDDPAPGIVTIPQSNKRQGTRLTDGTSHGSTGHPRKRSRYSPAQHLFEEDLDDGPISHWAEQRGWPEEYHQHEKNSRRHQYDSNDRTRVLPPPQYQLETNTDQAKLRALHTGNSYMHDSGQKMTDISMALCRSLLLTKYPTPRDTLFRNDVFPIACQNLQDKSEAKIIQDIGRLLVPSPESLAALAAIGAKHFDVLTESVNEGWDSCIPITSTRPQPDFAVGFKRSIFSDEQLTKLRPVLGDPSCLSYFKATYYMYFPFLTCEVVCGGTGLDIGDRQNAHSMTIAVRGIVELFKMVKRDNELNGKLLTFSVTHDHRMVRLYGHYPVIENSKTTKIYRHAIHTYALDGKDKWTTYCFVMEVYNHSLNLLNDIRSIVDGLPDDYVTQICAPEPLVSETDDEALQSPSVAQQITPDTSTQTGKAAPRKKPKRKTAG